MILGVDPGTRKCGYAVLSGPGAAPLEIGIVPTEQIAQAARTMIAAHPISAIALGRGTHAPGVAAMLAGMGIPIRLVDEYETTLRARARYFEDFPPRGWRRLIPRGMLLPPRPIDDYAALLIAERYFAS